MLSYLYNMALIPVVFEICMLMLISEGVSSATDSKRILVGDTDYIDNRLRLFEQTMNAKVQETETNSRNQIQNLTNALQETETKSKMQIQNLTRTIQDLQETEAKTKMQIQSLTQNIHVLQNQVQQTQNHIAFYATLSSHTTLGQKQTVEFDRVITNIGNAYNKISGVFTAPVAGLYQFSTTMLQVSNVPTKTIHTQIMKNNIPIGNNYGNENRASGTMNVVVSVAKNDIVYVRHSSELGATSQAIHGLGYTSFSGFLIAQSTFST